jgi:hypothetical protein
VAKVQYFLSHIAGYPAEESFRLPRKPRPIDHAFAAQGFPKSIPGKKSRSVFVPSREHNAVRSGGLQLQERNSGFRASGNNESFA